MVVDLVGWLWVDIGIGLYCMIGSDGKYVCFEVIVVFDVGGVFGVNLLFDK